MKTTMLALKPVRFFLFILLLLGCNREAAQQKVGLQWVNLAHLNHLYEEVVIDGKPMAIIHIYSEYPDYEWVDASDEGIACVDDVARAAVVYLRHFEITEDSASLERARKLLEFCRYMQAEDGQFYNFIYQDRSRNTDGKTSFKSFGWWAARGLWALGEGYRVFLKRDPQYARQLETQIKKTFPQIDSLLRHYPVVETTDGFSAPQWLLYNSAADATSELMLGLAAYAKASGNPIVLSYLEKFGEGLLAMQLEAGSYFPSGLHLSWQNTWHAWANGQTQALGRLASLVENPQFIEAARLECTDFYPKWIEHGFPREMTFVHNGTPKIDKIMPFDQIAYGLRPAVVGALVLADLTGEEQFSELAAKLATWFFKSNPAIAQMYDPKTGRCYDGILSATQVNRNSGAESTIEALYALLEVEADPVAKEWLMDYLETQNSGGG